MSNIKFIFIPILSSIITFFFTWFHVKRSTKTLKKEYEIKQKIIEQNDKVETGREEINEVYKKAREHIGDTYTVNNSVRPSPFSRDLPTKKATLFTVGGKIQGMGKRKPAKASKPYP